MTREGSRQTHLLCHGRAHLAARPPVRPRGETEEAADARNDGSRRQRRDAELLPGRIVVDVDRSAVGRLERRGPSADAKGELRGKDWASSTARSS